MVNYFARPYNHTANSSHDGIPYRVNGVDTQGEIDTDIKVGRSTVIEYIKRCLQIL
ncbi:MAG: hypothetical protein U0T36_03540 [Saprospiraceae bacterium]